MLNRHSIIQLVLFGLCGSLVGIIFILLEQGSDKIFPLINGLTAGLLIGLLIGTYELFVFNSWVIKKSFISILAYRLIVYLVSGAAVVLFIVTINRAIRYDQSFMESLFSEESRDYIVNGKFKNAVYFTFMLSLLANFTRLIGDKLGRGTLINFILGIYHKPRLVNRAFLFIQVLNANDVLKKYGVKSYHYFLNKLYIDVSIAVMHQKGFMYEYVDDQIIAYWKIKKTSWPKRMIQCQAEIQSRINRDSNYYINQYDLQPHLYFTAHCGPVIQAEVGELKTEIVFHGDVLNTTARIASIGIEKQARFVISENLAHHLNMKVIKSNTIGTFEIRGKQQGVQLYTLSNDVN